MNKHSAGCRLLSALLVLVMVLSVTPLTQLNVFAASNDITKDSTYTYSNFDYSDTINLPIKIYEYDADGILFEYLSDINAGGSYFRDKDGNMTQEPNEVNHANTKAAMIEIFGTHWVDYNVYDNGGGFTNSLYNNCRIPTDDTEKPNKQMTAEIMGTRYDGRYVKYSSDASTIRDWGKMGNFTALNPSTNKAEATTVNIEDVRYFVMSYRCSTSDTDPATGSPRAAVGLSCLATTDGSAMEGAGVFSGWTFLKQDSKNWNYIIIDLQAGAPGEKGITQSTLSEMYIRMPTFKTGDYIEIGGFGFFPNYQTAERFGVYSASTGTDTDTQRNTATQTGYTYSTNRGLTFTNSDVSRLSNNTESVQVKRIDEWLTNPSFTYDDLNQLVTVLGADETLTFDDQTDYKMGYSLFQTVSGTAAIGLLESYLDEEGRPVYKRAAIDYTAVFLRDRLGRKVKYDPDGWLNHSYLRGSSLLFSEDLNGNGQIDANEQTDLASAIGKLCGADSMVSNANQGNTGSYANTMAYIEDYKAVNGGKNPLIGPWHECKEHIDSYVDAAYYILHNLFVDNSYNESQNTYNYLVLPSAYDSSINQRTYIFDPGFTKISDLNAPTLSNTKSSIVYNTNGTITLSDSNSKGLVEYINSNNISTLYPFLPVHSVAGDPGSQKPSTLVYYGQEDVPMTTAHGGTYMDRDYHYTLASQGTFFYDKSANYYFDFNGDDDVYLFINGELVLDIGGTHGITRSTIYINDYVQWAQKVLKTPGNYSAEDQARAKKLNLVDGLTYRFDFFYMERHGTGANLRISTNIPVTDPNLGVKKSAYQNGVEIPKGGAAVNTELVEYAFSLTNGTEDKLYNIAFDDKTLGVKLNSSDTPFTAGSALNSNGETLSVTDLVAYVDGFTQQGEKTETVRVTFKNAAELKSFMANLDAKGTDSGEGFGDNYSGDGLWRNATVTIRGIYYRLPLDRHTFTNTVSATAEHKKKITFYGADTHRLFTSGEPAFFMWANHRLTISKEEIYNGVLKSKSISEQEKENLPNLGSIQFQLVDVNGVEYHYENISLTGADTYVNVNYETPGAHLFYVKAFDMDYPGKSMVIPVTIYAMQPDHDYFVLDYGLSSVLTDGPEMTDDPFLKGSGSDTTASVMGFISQRKYVELNQASYQEKEVTTGKPLGGTYNTSTQTFNNVWYSLGKTVTLSYQKPWVIEVVAKGPFTGGEVLLSGNENHNTANNTYIAFYANSLGLCYSNSSGTQYVAGISYNTIATALGTTVSTLTGNERIYRIVNRLLSDGTSVAYLYVDGVEIGPMNQCSSNGTSAATADNSKRDFTFNYVGSTGNKLNNSSFSYLKIWTEGDNATHNRWENSNGVLTAVTLDDNPKFKATRIEGSNSGTAMTDQVYQLEKTISLRHDQEWSVKWKANCTRGGGTFLLSSMPVAGTNKNLYLWIRTAGGDLLLGYYDSTDGKYYQSGITIGASMVKSGLHAFELRNRVGASGNMVYLYVDGVEIGAMDNYYINGTAQGTKTDWLSGLDLSFNYLGANGRPITGSFSYVQVDSGIEKNAPDVNWQFVRNAAGEYVDLLSSNGGNRLNVTGRTNLPENTANGTYTVDSLTNQLTFTPNSLGAWEDSMYVMLTVHKKGYTPTHPARSDNPAYDIDIAKEAQMVKQITVIPANVVYFEDDFPAIKYAESTENTITRIGSGSGSLQQSSDQSSNYGSDKVYQNDTNTAYSGDSLHKIQIAKHGTLAYFTFTGTGMELIARSNARDSGSIYLMIYEKTEGVTVSDAGVVSGADPIEYVPVITEFDNHNDLGAEEIYQIPIVRWENGGQEAKEYIVLIQGVPPYGTTDPYYLYLDGIRIYQPLGAANEHYISVENGAKFIEIRDYIINGSIAAAEFDGENVTVGVGSLTWTENRNDMTSDETVYVGNKVTNVNDYLMMGPNNEVYMDGTFTHSALVFYVKEVTSGGHDLQIGVRALDYGLFVGAGRTYENVQLQYGIKTVQGGNEVYQWVNLATSSTGTEQYFSIPYAECPLVDGYYQVAIRVDAVNSYTPAFAAFTTLKMNGLVLKTVSGDVRTLSYRGDSLVDTETGEIVSGDGYLAFDTASRQLRSNAVYNCYAGVPGDDFSGVDQQAQIIPQYPTLSFEDEVYYDVHFTLNGLDHISTDDMGLITFDSQPVSSSMDNARDIIPGAMLMNGNYVVRTNGIPAMKLADTLWFKIYVKLADGSYVYSDLLSYSALTYANNILAKPAHADVHPLLVAMLNYGAAAQEYFGYRTDDLMNAGLTEEQKALTEAYRPDMIRALQTVDAGKSGIFGQNVGGFTRKSPAVTFSGAFAINYFMTPANPVDGEMTMYYWSQEDLMKADVLTAENATGVLPMTERGNGTYTAAVSGLAAKQIDETVTVACVYQSGGVTYSTGLLRYSLGTYCKNIAGNNVSGAQELAAATAVYGYYAEDYFGN